VKHYLYIFILSCISLQFYSQHKEESGVNLPKFYKNKLHFGFALAFNKTDFRIHTVKNSELPDTIIAGVKYGFKSIYTNSDPGFALGLIADARLHEYIRLRFTPKICFSSRSLDYTLQNARRDSTREYKKSVESTFIILPLEIKLQSKRLDNFAAYVIFGGGYALDLVSKKKGQAIGGANQLDDAILLKRDDFFYSGGAGVDFYLKYFKLSLEVKLMEGTKNLIQRTNNVFSNSLNKVNSKMMMFSISFEG